MAMQRKSHTKRNGANRRKQDAALSYGAFEPRNLLATFYVDAVTGADSNSGTSDAPFQSYLPLVTAYGQEDPNVGKITLEPGDEVVFAAGVYTETFQLPGSSINHGFRLRNVHGTDTEPITLRAESGAILQGTADNGSEVTKLELFDTSHFVIEGFEVTGLGTGIQISNSQDILVQENWIHDIEGQASTIIAGLAISGSSDVEATANLIHDNYDRSTPAFNSYNVEFDENTGMVEFHNNYVFNSDDNIRTGTGPGVKHDGAGLLEIHHNVIENAANAGIALDTRLASVHHNLVLNSEAFWLVPNSSLVANEELHQIDVSHNTIVDQTENDRVGGGLNFAARVQDSEGQIRFDQNIVVDLDAQGEGQGILNLATYGSNEEYRFWIESGRFQADGNVYSNPNHDVIFDVYSSSSRGDLGGQYDFQEWQQLGFDTQGLVADPNFDDGFHPQNRDTAEAGWYGGEAARLTVLASNQSTVARGRTETITITRSGEDVDLGVSQVVQLTGSSQQISLPSTVTFQPGERTVDVEVPINHDSVVNSVQAVRISATAAGFENNVSTWLRLEPSDSNLAPPTVVALERDGAFVEQIGQLDRPDRLQVVSATFSSQVNIHLNDLTLINRSAGNSAVDLSNVEFRVLASQDSSTMTAEWDFTNTGLVPGIYEFVLDGNGIVNPDNGLRLDGDHDGQNGGDYSAEIYVAIPGDTNLDGRVDVLNDAFWIVSNLGQNNDASWRDGDFNDDDRVDAPGDAFALVQNLGRDIRPTIAYPTRSASQRSIATTENSQVLPIVKSLQSTKNAVTQTVKPVLVRDEFLLGTYANNAQITETNASVSDAEALTLAGNYDLVDSTFGAKDW